MRLNVALDTNLLVLLCIGTTRPALLGRHKRLKAYSKNDHVGLRRQISGAEKLVVLPYAIAEVSNLLDKDDLWPSVYVPFFRELVANAEEISADSANILSKSTTGWLGVTDSAWVHLIDEATLLLTADNRLFHEAQRAGRATRLFQPEAVQ
jgi:hypothetical protein